jgi:hypothetical protein
VDRQLTDPSGVQSISTHGAKLATAHREVPSYTECEERKQLASDSCGLGGLSVKTGAGTIELVELIEDFMVRRTKLSLFGMKRKI